MFLILYDKYFGFGEKMKKILHLFRAEKFTEAFIDLMKKFQEEHFFWVFGEELLDEQAEYLNSENVKYYPRIDIKMNKCSTKNELQQYDLIVYHGVFDKAIVEYFYIHKEFLKKLALYFWGGDKEHISEWKKEKRYIVKNAAAIVTIIPQDYWELKKYCKLKGKFFCARYNGNTTFEAIDKIANINKVAPEVINIQVGNSATETNNHINILRNLSKFKEEDIKVYVPLSYGDMDYAEKVIRCGEKVLGDKFIPIQQFMPFVEYCRFMCNMDVGIFDMKRQQAMGNIIALMYIGRKVFFNRESLLWDFFSNDLGCIVSDTTQISKINIKEFVGFSEKDMLFNRAKVREKFSEEESIRAWKTLYDSF